MDVLIIRFSSLGDIVIATAVVEAINRKIPEARIHFLTKNTYADIFKGDRRIENLVAIQGNESPYKIFRLLGQKSFNAVIDLHRSLRSTSVNAFIRSPLKSTVNKHSLARRLMVLSRNRFRRSFDMLGSYLETLAPLGISEKVFPRIVPDTQAMKKAEEILKGLDKGLFGLAPGSRHSTKCWGEKSFARLADEIAGRGILPVFIGDENDTEAVERIRSRMSEESISFAGKIDLAVTIAVVSQLQGIITNDSGPMHIAGALGIPFAAIFGPTHPGLGFAPGYPSGTLLHSRAPCSPCSVHGDASCRMEKRVCMDEITYEMVMEKMVCGL
ncbi:MAG: glycosyltransferase family 9 protein [Candidatus Latescibacteria bacterium]|jgi:heptosyltransferase II|nr:glycosyltransferase family 9 protein [Candidatus Latescibacterota bacterium]